MFWKEIKNKVRVEEKNKVEENGLKSKEWKII